MGWKEDAELTQSGYYDEETGKPYEIERYELDPTAEFQAPENLLESNGIGTFSRKDILVIGGKAKNGKSFVVSIFVASVLGCSNFFTPIKKDATVFYFDTEQSVCDNQIIRSRVAKLMGWKPNRCYRRFRYFELRMVNKEERFSYICEMISKYKPLALIIDGCTDLMTNPNDLEESQDLVLKLLDLCSHTDIALLTVVHENKGKDDNALRGHIGAELLRKAVSVFHVTKDKDKGIFSVENTECRRREIETWSFRIDEHGMPIPTETPDRKAEKETAKTKDLRLTFADVFSDGNPRLYTELKNDLESSCSISVATAKRKIADATKLEIIRCEGGKYTLSPTPETE